MATIYPTASIHYTKSAGDPSQLLAPPYDVIDDDAARTLRDLSPYNAVRLILPEGKAPARYQLAASRLRRWLTEGVLARSDKDALYLYRQEFSHAGSSVARTAILTALELTGFDHGEVLPHERTHAAPKKDRLALMKACRAQLSPVFAIAPDPKGQLQELVARADTDAPILMARTPDDIRHTLWRVPKAVEAPLLRAAAAPAFLIADGHHRYETALQLARDLPERAAAGRVLAAVVGEYDPGLIVQATHRRLTGLPADWLERLTVAFEVESGPEAPDALAAEVGRRGGGGHRRSYDRRHDPYGGCSKRHGAGAPAVIPSACATRLDRRRSAAARRGAACLHPLRPSHPTRLDAPGCRGGRSFGTPQLPSGAGRGSSDHGRPRSSLSIAPGGAGGLVGRCTGGETASGQIDLLHPEDPFGIDAPADLTLPSAPKLSPVCSLRG